MLENFISGLLEKYLGEYVENLDTKNLRIALWGGNLELENLRLKASALADIGFPLTIRAGYLKTLKLKIPWKNMYSESVKVEVKGLYLLILPKSDVKYDEEKEIQAEYEYKMRKVKRIEEMRKEKEESESPSVSNKPSDTFFERLQMQIIRNLDLTISDIHIRYEDKSSNPRHPFSAGLTLSCIDLKTTDKNGKISISSNSSQEQLAYKIAVMKALSLYWNAGDDCLSNLESNENIFNNLSRLINHEASSSFLECDYVLRPMDLSAQVKLLMKPQEMKFTEPMISLNVNLNEISLNLNRLQYFDVLNMIEHQDYIKLKCKYLKYRPPLSSVPYGCAEWWKFAYKVILSDQIRPRRESWRWSNIRQHRNNLREYRALFIVSATKGLPADKVDQMKSLEMKLDVFNITLVRSSAMKEVTNRLKAEKKKESWSGWLQSFWSSSATIQDEGEAKPPEITPDEKDKFYNAIGYAGSDMSFTTYPRQYVQMQADFDLRELKLALWMADYDIHSRRCTVSEHLLLSILSASKVSFHRRPADNAMGLNIELQKIGLFGRKPKRAEKSPQIITTEQSIDTRKLLQASFDINPLDKDNASYRIKMKLSSLALTYDAYTINTLMSYFTPTEQHHLESAKTAAFSTFVETKHRTKLLLQHNIDNIKHLDLDIYLKSSYLIVPHQGTYKPGCSLFCLDFGDFIISSSLKNLSQIGKLTTFIPGTFQHRESEENDEQVQQLRHKSYTWFDFILKDLQLLYIGKGSSVDWMLHKQYSATNATKNDHLIQPITINLCIGKCLYSDEAFLPQIRVHGGISLLKVAISEERLHLALAEFKDFPLPSKDVILNSTILDESISAFETSVSAEISMMRDIGSIPMSSSNVKSEDATGCTVDSGKSVQIIGLYVKLVIDRIELSLRDSASLQDSALLDFYLYNIGFCAQVQSSIQTFDIYLSDVEFFDRELRDENGGHLSILSTKDKAERKSGLTEVSEQTKLIKINAMMVDRDSSFFASKKVNLVVDIHLSQVAVVLRQEALKSILGFQSRFSESIENLFSKPKIESNFFVEHSLSFSQKSEKARALNQRKSLWNIYASWNKLTVRLSNQRGAFLDALLSGLVVKLTNNLNEESIAANVTLKNFQISDPAKNTLYRKILGPRQSPDQLIEVHVLLKDTPTHYKSARSITPNCKISAQLSKIECFVLFRVLNQLFDLLKELSFVKDSVRKAGEAYYASSTSKNQLCENDVDQVYKISLHIDFSAPVIYVPQNSESNHCLMLDFGELAMRTSFIRTEKSLIEKHEVKMNFLKASRILWLGNDTEKKNNLEVKIITCDRLSAELNRSLLSDAPDLAINLDWPRIEINLSKWDYCLIMRILAQNLSEWSGESPAEQVPAGTTEKNSLVFNASVDYEIKEHPNFQFSAFIGDISMVLYTGDGDEDVPDTDRNAPKLSELLVKKTELQYRLANVNQEMTKSEVSLRIQDLIGTDKRNLIGDSIDRDSSRMRRITKLIRPNRPKTSCPDKCMIELSVKSVSNSQASNSKTRGKLESFYLCMSIDYLLTLQDFFMSGLAALSSKKESFPSSSSKIENSLNDIDLDIDKPAIILLQNFYADETDLWTPNCLLLESNLSLKIKLFSGQTYFDGCVNSLTASCANITRLLKDNEDRCSMNNVKYRILTPTTIRLTGNLLSAGDGGEENCGESIKQSNKFNVEIDDVVINMAPIAINFLFSSIWFSLKCF